MTTLALVFRDIGSRLCDVEDLTLVTGGFYGVEYSVGKAFHETALTNLRWNKVWHILPERDEKV